MSKRVVVAGLEASGQSRASARLCRSPPRALSPSYSNLVSHSVHSRHSTLSPKAQLATPTQLLRNPPGALTEAAAVDPLLSFSSSSRHTFHNKLDLQQLTVPFFPTSPFLLFALKLSSEGNRPHKRSSSSALLLLSSQLSHLVNNPPFCSSIINSVLS